MPQRVAALVAAAIVAVAAATAGAAEAPGQYGGHGVSFTYPTTWQHIDGNFQVQVGSVLWTEIFAPMPPPADPAAPATPPSLDQLTDLIGVAAYRLRVSITKKNLPRYKQAIALTIADLVRRANGQLLSGPTRVTMGSLPGYQFEVTVPRADASPLDSRLVLVFKKKTEYFVNCQHLRDGALMAELTTGCDQLTQSFRLAPPSR